MTWKHKVDYNLIEKQFSKLENSSTKPFEEIQETHTDEQANEFFNHIMIKLHKKEIIVDEIRKILDAFTVFEKYDVEDYNEATEQINTLLEMIGK